jgi:antitoxin YefM
MVHTTYTRARANLAEYLNRTTEDNEIVIIDRKKSAAVALIAASELESLLETAHLFRSPENRKRLFQAYNRAEERSVEPSSVEELCKEIGLVEDQEG